MGKLFGSTPKVSAPVKMPDENDPAIREAAATRQRQIAARSGRTSTILSRPSSPGTGAYQNSLLGQAG